MTRERAIEYYKDLISKGELNLDGLKKLNVELDKTPLEKPDFLMLLDYYDTLNGGIKQKEEIEKKDNPRPMGQSIFDNNQVNMNHNVSRMNANMNQNVNGMSTSMNPNISGMNTNINQSINGMDVNMNSQPQQQQSATGSVTRKRVPSWLNNKGVGGVMILGYICGITIAGVVIGKIISSILN